MRDKNYNTCKFSEVIIHLSVLRRLRSRDTELMLKHSRRESRQVIRRTLTGMVTGTDVVAEVIMT